MENCLSSVIKKAASENNTSSLKKFISSESKRSLNITGETLLSLESIACNSNNKLEGVKVALSCLKYFIEHNLDTNVWDKLAEEFAQLFLTCLHESVKFLKSYSEDVSILVDLSDTISELISQSKVVLNVFHHNVFQPIITIITKENLLLHVKYSLAKALCSIAKQSGVNNHREINPLFQEDIEEFANWIFFCGNYEIQTIILETLLYFLKGIKDVNQFCARWFCINRQINKYFLKRDFTKEFDTEARIFLNMINTSSKNTLVFSIDAVCVFLDGDRLRRPNAKNCPGFWIDFNVGSESVLINYEGDNEAWEVIELEKLNIKEVCSNDSECILNNKVTPVAKLNFNLIGIGKTIVEIWFEISEQFLNLEKQFLIPIYGNRYQCNLKPNYSNIILSGEGMNMECLGTGKYTPLSVVITPTRVSSAELSQGVNDTSQLEVDIHGQSLSLESKEQSNIIYEHSDDSSCDEIICTPEKTLPKTISKMNLLKLHCKSSSANKLLREVTHTSQLEVDIHAQSLESKEQSNIIYEYSGDSTCDEIICTPEKTLPKTKSKINLLKSQCKSSSMNSTDTFSENNQSQNKNKRKVKPNSTNIHSRKETKSKKIRNQTSKINMVQNNNHPTIMEEEINKSGLNIQANEDETIPNLRSKNSFKKSGAKSNRNSRSRKKLFYPSDDNAELNSNSSTQDIRQEQECIEQLAVPKVSYSYRTSKEANLEKFKTLDFENENEFSSPHPQCSSSNTSTENKKKIEDTVKNKFFKHNDSNITPSKTPTKKIKSVYSDFSSSSTETLRSVKKTYLKQKNITKRKKKLKASLKIVPKGLPENSLTKDNMSQQLVTESSYVSRLDTTNLDPLRFNNDIDPNYEVIGIHEKSVLKPRVVGESVLTNCEIMDQNLTQLALQDDQLDNESVVPFERENICNKTNPGMKMSLRRKKTVLKNTKKTTCFKKENIANQSAMFKNMWKHIQETDKDFKTERRRVYSKFLSSIELHEKHISSVELQLDKCKVILEKSNQNFQVVTKSFTESILEMESRHTALLDKYLKEMKAEVNFFFKECLEE